MRIKTWLAGLFASDGDRSPWGSFWFQPVGGSAIGGVRVSADTAMQLSAVYRAVSLLSGHMAMLPVRFYKSGTRKQVKHPLLQILNVRPNRWQNAFEWREMVQGHLELRGNAYNEIIANGRGEIAELIPRHPDKVKVEILDNGDYRYRITGADGIERPVPRGQIWHLRGLSSNGVTGLSVIACARDSLGVGLAAQNYGARFFGNDAKPSGGWLEFPGKFADENARKVFRDSWMELQGGANQGKTAVLDMGMKYHEMGMTNEDAQFLETRKFSISDIARWFGVPPHKLGDLEKATFSNIEQQALEYIQDALQPRVCRMRASIQAELLFDDEEIDIEFDFRELMRGDSSQRSRYYHAGILDGWMTRNEARQMEGFEPLAGLDEPLRPLNMVEERDAEDDQVDTEATEKPDQEPGEPKQEPEDKEAMRLRALLAANAGRLARRIARSGSVSPEMLVDALAVSPALALNWCESTHPGDEGLLTQSLINLAEGA